MKSRMNRWAVLAVLPYVVTVSTVIDKDNPHFERVRIANTNYRCERQLGDPGCDFIYDLAEALNYAHNRRVHGVGITEWDGKPAGTINKADLDKMTPPPPERGENAKGCSEGNCANR